MKVPELPRQDQWILSRIHTYAAEAARNLSESWKRPVRHNKKLERLALWHTVELEHELRSEGGQRLFPLASYVGTPEVRYEANAAVSSIPALLPFDPFQWNRLRGSGSLVEADDWSQALDQQEPGLAGRWHGWLWAGGSDTAHDYGRASELAIAAERLSESIPVILGWQDR